MPDLLLQENEENRHKHKHNHKHSAASGKARSASAGSEEKGGQRVSESPKKNSCRTRIKKTRLPTNTEDPLVGPHSPCVAVEIGSEFSQFQRVVNGGGAPLRNRLIFLLTPLAISQMGFHTLPLGSALMRRLTSWPSWSWRRWSHRIRWIRCLSAPPSIGDHIVTTPRHMPSYAPRIYVHTYVDRCGGIIILDK